MVERLATAGRSLTDGRSETQYNTVMNSPMMINTFASIENGASFVSCRIIVYGNSRMKTASMYTEMYMCSDVYASITCITHTTSHEHQLSIFFLGMQAFFLPFPIPSSSSPSLSSPWSHSLPSFPSPVVKVPLDSREHSSYTVPTPPIIEIQCIHTSNFTKMHIGPQSPVLGAMLTYSSHTSDISL